MVSVNKLVTMPEITLELRKRAQNIKSVLQDKQAITIDIKMASAYLELATYKDKSRFNSAEITELIDILKNYKSKIPASDIIKRLLNIGLEKGQPLQTQEIKDFFYTTPLLDKKGQERVIEFIKALKEHDSLKYNLQYIKKNNSFEKFKKDEVEKFPSVYNDLSEGELKNFYLDRMNKEIKFSQNSAYTGQFNVNPANVSDFINLNTLEFVYGVANCKKPAILAQIAIITGIKPALIKIPDNLVKIFEFSKGNVELLHDIVRCFFPEEIIQISSKLIESKGAKDLINYHRKTTLFDEDTLPIFTSHMANLRRDILESMNIQHPYNEEVSANMDIIAKRYNIFEKLLKIYKKNGVLTDKQKKEADNIISEIYYLMANADNLIKSKEDEGICDGIMKEQKNDKYIVTIEYSM